MSNSNHNPVGGHWVSAVGSPLYLEVEEGKVTGHFRSTDDPVTVPIHGSIAMSPTSPNFIPVAFSASWPKTKAYDPAVTSYTGQYSNVNGVEQIEVIFLLETQATDTALFKTTQIASDVFMRPKPKDE